MKTMAYGRIWTSRDDFRLDWRPGVEAGSQRRGEAGQGQGERSGGHAMHKGQEGSYLQPREVEKEKSKGEVPDGSLSDVWTRALAGGRHRGEEVVGRPEERPAETLMVSAHSHLTRRFRAPVCRK